MEVVQASEGIGFFNGEGKFLGKIIQIEGDNATLFCGFAAEGVKDDEMIAHISDTVGEAWLNSGEVLFFHDVRGNVFLSVGEGIDEFGFQMVAVLNMADPIGGGLYSVWCVTGIPGGRFPGVNDSVVFRAAPEGLGQGVEDLLKPVTIRKRGDSGVIMIHESFVDGRDSGTDTELLCTDRGDGFIEKRADVEKTGVLSRDTEEGVAALVAIGVKIERVIFDLFFKSNGEVLYNEISGVPEMLP